MLETEKFNSRKSLELDEQVIANEPTLRVINRKQKIKSRKGQKRAKRTRTK